MVLERFLYGEKIYRIDHKAKWTTAGKEEI